MTQRIVILRLFYSLIALNSSAGTFENFQSFSVADPVNVTNTGLRTLIFRSANVGFTLLPGQSQVLEPALHVYKVYTQVITPTLRGGIFIGKESENKVEVGPEDGISTNLLQTTEAAFGGPRHGSDGLIIPLNTENISIASIAYSSPVLFMVHEGEAVVGASFTSNVSIVSRPSPLDLSWRLTSKV